MIFLNQAFIKASSIKNQQSKNYWFSVQFLYKVTKIQLFVIFLTENIILFLIFISINFNQYNQQYFVIYIYI